MNRTPRDPKVQKLSNSKSVGFRPGEKLRRELENLSDELCRRGSRFTVSDILREGVTAYWLQIRALMRAKARTGNVPNKTAVRIIGSTMRAHQMGLGAQEIARALQLALAQRRLSEARKSPRR